MVGWHAKEIRDEAKKIGWRRIKSNYVKLYKQPATKKKMQNSNIVRVTDGEVVYAGGYKEVLIDSKFNIISEKSGFSKAVNVKEIKPKKEKKR
jgi:hypothetical protein